MLLALRRYVDFRGRSRRREYWMFVLLCLIAIVLAGVVMIAATGSFRTQEQMATKFTAWAGFAIAPLIIPLIAVTIRRVHDLGLSGWWLLALPIGAAIPMLDTIVGIAQIIVMAIPGKTGANRFGDSPKASTTTGIPWSDTSGR
ncbi:DUF805 domain-containing protein [Sphingomonas montana]|uniref:DUF805 domain-containing protein n=1 Tax=Sphingomonas montana TaxID=1843236 RepID=UPI0019D28A2B|nr:DUF805 domain-containing protein [Sphingomonas montana]